MHEVHMVLGPRARCWMKMVPDAAHFLSSNAPLTSHPLPGEGVMLIQEYKSNSSPEGYFEMRNNQTGLRHRLRPAKDSLMGLT